MDDSSDLISDVLILLAALSLDTEHGRVAVFNQYNSRTVALQQCSALAAPAARVHEERVTRSYQPEQRQFLQTTGTSSVSFCKPLALAASVSVNYWHQQRQFLRTTGTSSVSFCKLLAPAASVSANHWH